MSHLGQALVRQVWRGALRARFLLTQRHRHNRLALERVAGRPLLVLPGVFNPALFFSSELLAGALDARLVPPGCAALDLGTGSGVGAIAAAQWAARVVAVDINPEAVRCARINALLNNVDGRVEVRQGDLFAPVAGERFDVALFNPPYFSGAPRDMLDTAFRSPGIAERFARGLPEHLAPGGSALVVLSSVGDEAGFLGAFRAAGLGASPVARRSIVSETLTVYRLQPGAAQ